MLKEKFPSLKLPDILPDFFLKDGALLVKFITHYYEWLESLDQSTYVARRLQEYSDVDTAPANFMQWLRNEFMRDIPPTIVDERTLLKNIKDFYRARGSEKAIRLLFRILYNEEIDIYYPGEDILRASAGHWVKDRSIRTELIDINFSDDDSFIPIYGSISGATARIDRVNAFVENQALIYEFFITNIRGDFLFDEYIVRSTTDTIISRIISDGVIEHTGRYEGTYGFLSSDKYLQDNFYYQEYSYVIRSNQSIAFYRDIVKSLNHPAGTLMFGSIQIVPNITQELSVETDIDYKYILNILFDFFVEVLVGVGDAGVETNLVFSLNLNMYLINDWNFEAITEPGKVSSWHLPIVYYWKNKPVDDYALIPVKYMGTRRMLSGIDTAFLSEMNTDSYLEMHKPEREPLINMIAVVSSDRAALLYHTVVRNIHLYNYRYSDGLDNMIVIHSIDSWKLGAGLVDIANSGVDYYQNLPIEEYGNVPLDLMETRFLMHGNNTVFLDQLVSGMDLEVFDSNTIHLSTQVAAVYSNTVSSVVDDQVASDIFQKEYRYKELPVLPLLDFSEIDTTYQRAENDMYLGCF